MQDAVDVVGHGYEFAQLGIGEVIGDFVPKVMGDFAGRRKIQLRGARKRDAAKIVPPATGANRDEIGPSPAIIPPGSTCGGNSVFVLKLFHVHG